MRTSKPRKSLGIVWPVDRNRDKECLRRIQTLNPLAVNLVLECLVAIPLLDDKHSHLTPWVQTSWDKFNLQCSSPHILALAQKKNTSATNLCSPYSKTKMAAIRKHKKNRLLLAGYFMI
jgi:hypothetical protein